MYVSTFSRTLELISNPRFLGLNSSKFMEEWQDLMTALSKQFPRRDMLVMMPLFWLLFDIYKMCTEGETTYDYGTMFADINWA